MGLVGGRLYSTWLGWWLGQLWLWVLWKEHFCSTGTMNVEDIVDGIVQTSKLRLPSFSVLREKGEKVHFLFGTGYFLTQIIWYCWWYSPNFQIGTSKLFCVKGKRRNQHQGIPGGIPWAYFAHMWPIPHNPEGTAEGPWRYFWSHCTIVHTQEITMGTKMMNFPSKH